MNKIFVLLLVIPVFLAACCVPVEKKSEVTKTYKNGKKKVTCKYTGTGEDKTLIERITYNKVGKVTIVEDMVKHTGSHFSYRKNGKKEKETRFRNRKKHGYSRIWDSKERLKSEMLYDSGKLVKSVFYKKGTLAREEFYKQGERIKAKWYYPDGLLSDHREYRKGKKHGRWLHIDKTGKLVLDESFKNDKPVKK